MQPVQHILTVDKAPRKSGIYAIVCETNGKRYVGSSVNIRVRLQNHVKGLNKGKHPSRHLQSAWKKRGELVFHFEILELCSKTKLIKCEQRWLDFYNSSDNRHGYNIRSVAHANHGVKFTKAACRNISRSKTGVRHTEQSRKNMAAAQRGRKHSKATIKKLSGKVPWNKGLRYSCPAISKIKTGKKFSEKQRLAHKAAMKILGKIRKETGCMKWDEELKLVMSVVSKGVPKSEKHRRNIAAANRRPDKRKATSLAMRGKPKSAEQRKNMSIAQKKRYAEQRA